MLQTQTSQDTTKNVTAKRRSVALTWEEHKALKKYARGFATATEAAESLGMTPQVMNRIIMVGSGSPEKISLIRGKLSTAA